MAAIATGDAQAFARLADRHTNRALAYVTRLLNGDRATAEDIVQDGFLRVWQNAKTWEPQAQFNTWFYTILYRLCVDHWRKNRRLMVELDEGMPDTGINAESHVMAAQEKQSVHDALQQLPENQRSALMLFHTHDMSQNEIAGAMNLSVGAVEALLFRGRQKLKTILFRTTHPQTGTPRAGSSKSASEKETKR